MPRSMTGFAARQGEGAGHLWAWEARSVNGKGFDLRLRLPEGIDGLEAALRAAAQARFQRGNMSVSLKLERLPAADEASLDPSALARALANLARIEAEAMKAGLTLRDSSAAEILGLRGLAETAPPEGEAEALGALLFADIAPLLDALAAARGAEGQALGALLSAQAARIESLTQTAALAARARAPAQAEALKAALARVMDGAPGADPQRIAQELAMIAVKSDVTEELDRLAAHIGAARALLSETAPIGRRLDFLAQEFNREANTLASKAGDAALTRIALDLKAAIDQFREQVQNLE